MGKVSNIIKYDGVSVGEDLYNAMNDKSVYEVYYHDGTMEQLKANTTQGKKLLIQFSQTQHPQLAGSKTHRFICIWVHLITPHTKMVGT